MSTRQREAERDERVLVHAPTEEDAKISECLLVKAYVDFHICRDMGSLCAEAARGAGAVLLTEETFAGDTSCLMKLLQEQPSWSDLPLIILISGSTDTAQAKLVRELPGDVTLLERPVQILTLVTTLHSVLRSRRRQYALRDEQHQAAERERALRETESWMTIAAESAGIGFWEWDGLTQSISWDNRCRDIFGIDTTGPVAIGTFLAALHSEDREAVERKIREAAGGREGYDIEYRIRDRGEIRWVHAIGRAALSAPQRMYGIVIDVTRRKESEQHLEESRRQLRTIIETALVPIAYLDEQQRYLFANELYRRRVNEGSADLEGKDIRSVIGDENYAVIREPLAKAYAGQQCRLEIERGVPGTSERRTYQLAYAPDTDGTRVRGVVVAMNDISDLKLAEKSLVAAKETAEAANRAKSEFLANMSHEMRTPLAGVLGMLDLVLQTVKEGEERRLLRLARKAGTSLLQIISDILDFSRLEAGKTAFEPAPLDLRKTVESAVQVVALEAAAKGLALQTSVADNVPPLLWGDERRLRQVLVNLLGNAVKFTAAGEVEVVVATGVDPRDPGCTGVVFFVRDTGIGIPSEKMDSLFRLFTQVDASTTRRYGGTGLGLALAREIVEQMDGHIWADSTPGKGSVFSFFVPLQPPPVTGEERSP